MEVSDERCIGGSRLRHPAGPGPNLFDGRQVKAVARPQVSYVTTRYAPLALTGWLSRQMTS